MDLSQKDHFVHDNKPYDLDKLRILLRPEKAFLLPISQLVWVLKHDTPDPKRVKLSRMRWPLIVTKWRGKWTVIDGLHRLERCRQRGITIVPVKEATQDMLKQVLIHT